MEVAVGRDGAIALQPGQQEQNSISKKKERKKEMESQECVGIRQAGRSQTLETRVSNLFLKRITGDPERIYTYYVSIKKTFLITGEFYKW